MRKKHGPELTPEQIGHFERDGFLCVEGVTSRQEIAELRAFYDALVEERLGCAPDQMHRSVRLHERPLLVVYPPAEHLERLRGTRLGRAARRVAAQLLGVGEAQVITGFRFFLKPPGYPETAWHQDAAYRPPPHHNVSLWIPLDPATPESSCLAYLPGSHRGGVVLPHRLDGDHLVLDGVDAGPAVLCPIQPTGAAVHHTCVVHRATPNTTAAPRRAIGVVCRIADPPSRTESLAC